MFSDSIAGASSAANAFAAEILSPVALVRRKVARRMLDLDDVNEIAVEIEAPPKCVYHQILNHDVAFVRMPELTK